MFDVGFWELLLITVVLLVVLGPERMPEMARHAAYLVRKARRGLSRFRADMREQIGEVQGQFDDMQGQFDDTAMGDLHQARQEITSLQKDIKSFGHDLADSHERKVHAAKKR